MKKIDLCCTDLEECIRLFRKLSEDLADDAVTVNTMASAGEISVQKAGELVKKIKAEAENASFAADKLSKILEVCENAEENAGVLIRKTIFENRGRIVVEKTKEPVTSALINGKTLKHDSSLVKLVLKEKSGELK